MLQLLQVLSALAILAAFTFAQLGPLGQRSCSYLVLNLVGAAPRHEPCVDEVTFDGLRLFTLPGRVMTPRATSEQLVDAARARIGGGAARVADVGTGGGAIAIAIATACPSAEMWATDISASAVILACANVRRHGLAGRVHVRQGDLLTPVSGRFDVIVANLPYVPAVTAAAHPELAEEPFDAVFAPRGRPRALPPPCR